MPSKIKSMEISILQTILAAVLLLGLVTPTTTFAQLHLTNVTVVDNEIQWTSPPGYCCGGGEFEGFPVTGACRFPPCSGVSFTGTMYCNRPGTYNIQVCGWSSVTDRLCETTAVTVTMMAPFSCPAFRWEIFNGLEGGHVLTHKYQPNTYPPTDTYPTGQTSDHVMTYNLRPIRALTGSTAYLRVIDPPDTSTYVVPPRPAPDNKGAPGLISLSPGGGGASSLTVVVPEFGSVPVYLDATADKAGDNYRIWASGDPAVLQANYACGVGCFESPLETAWKRIYLEWKKMFKSGALLTTLAPAGQPKVVVRESDATFSVGEYVTLVHAPNVDGSGNRQFYQENRTVQAIARNTPTSSETTLTFNFPLDHSYGPDSQVDALANGLSDGVGRVSLGYYDIDPMHLDTVLAQSFVEFKKIPTVIDTIPYVPLIKDAYRLANRWFEHSPVNSLVRRGDSNVRHFLMGSGTPDSRNRLNPQYIGVTGIPTAVEVEPNYTWVLHTAIRATFSEAQTPIVAAENGAHEMAHVFSSNWSTYQLPSNRGHCVRNMALTPAKLCTMNGNKPNADSADNVVGFHYTTETDSEYMTIRWQSEPLPVPLPR